MTSSAPFEMYARPVGSPIDTPQDRLVIPAAAIPQLEAAFAMDPDDPQMPETFAEVLDLVTRQRVRIRRANCGLACACAREWWPATRTEPVPSPEPYDYPELHFEEEDEDGA